MSNSVFKSNAMEDNSDLTEYSCNIVWRGTDFVLLRPVLNLIIFGYLCGISKVLIDTDDVPSILCAHPFITFHSLCPQL